MRINYSAVIRVPKDLTVVMAAEGAIAPGPREVQDHFHYDALVDSSLTRLRQHGR